MVQIQTKGSLVMVLMVFGMVSPATAGGHHGGLFGNAGHYLALEMIENRCASQVGKFVRGSPLFAKLNGVVDLGNTQGTNTPGLLAAQGKAVPGVQVGPTGLAGVPGIAGVAAVNPAAFGRKLVGIHFASLSKAVIDLLCPNASDDVS